MMFLIGLAVGYAIGWHRCKHGYFVSVELTDGSVWKL